MTAERILVQVLAPASAAVDPPAPEAVGDLPWEVEVLAIVEPVGNDVAERVPQDCEAPLTETAPVTILKSPVPLRYGLRRKLGFEYAIRHGFHVMVTVPGFWAVTRDTLQRMVPPDRHHRTVLFARYPGRWSRPWTHRLPARPDCESWPVSALRRIPFATNRDSTAFDVDLRVQSTRAGLELQRETLETDPPTRPKRPGSKRYLPSLGGALILARLQSYGIFYRPRFDTSSDVTPYQLKAGYTSSHTMAIDAVDVGDRVLDLGSGPGLVAHTLHRTKSCRVTAVDRAVLTGTARSHLESQVIHDLDDPGWADHVAGDFDTVLILDVIEHLREPERFLETLRSRFAPQRPRIVLTTANVAFLPIRGSLLLGFFNYGPRGILDRTHCRLFTFGSLREALEQSGLVIEEIRGIPAPFPLALGDTLLARLLLSLNRLAIRACRSLFSYQIYVRASLAPTLESLEERTRTAGEPPRRRRARGAARRVPPAGS